MHVVVIPCYGYQDSLDSLLANLKEYTNLYPLIIDDGSTPSIRGDGVEIIRHPSNRGYGAAQKTGYRRALELGAERILLIHGDAQYSATHIVEALKKPTCDILLGSRLLHPQKNNMPRWRMVGNQMLTQLANHRFKQQYTDLHTGARIFQRSFLRTLPFQHFSNDFVFDQQVLRTTESVVLRTCFLPTSS